MTHTVGGAVVAVPVEDLDERAETVPVQPAEGPSQLSNEYGVTRYRQSLPNQLPLDVLALRQPSDVLVVSFHGAIDRAKFTVPRFERLKSVRTTGYSYLSMADPALHLGEKFQLAWYAGDYTLDIFPILADWVTAAAERFDARRVVVSGSSGGGFASLQVAALVPGAVACVFNPQTAINRYLHPRWGAAAQRRFLELVMPELRPQDQSLLGTDHDWTLPLGDRLSAVRRYRNRTGARVLYATNVQDWHHTGHYAPFAEARAAAGESHLLRTIEYDDGLTHRPPNPSRFLSSLSAAAEWAGEMGAGYGDRHE